MNPELSLKAQVGNGVTDSFFGGFFWVIINYYKTSHCKGLEPEVYQFKELIAPIALYDPEIFSSNVR